MTSADHLANRLAPEAHARLHGSDPRARSALSDYVVRSYNSFDNGIHALFVVYQSLLSSLDSLFAYLDLLLHLYIDYRNKSLDSIDSLLYTLYLYI